jgi:hypothetical protein
MSRDRSKKSKWLWRAAVLGLMGAAVVTELRKPQEERAWHGKVAGFVPYELRRPTLQRMRETYWAPSDEHIIKPTVWGVGWTLNLGRVARMIRRERVDTSSMAA